MMLYITDESIYALSWKALVVGLLAVSGTAHALSCTERRIERAYDLVDYFDITRDKLEDVEDRWYALHQSCDGSNSSAAYDNYEETYDFGKENILGGEYDVDIVDETYECINTMKEDVQEMLDDFE
jgi:hypothetical protein